MDYYDLRWNVHSLSVDALEAIQRKSLHYAERLRFDAAHYGQYRYKTGNEPALLYASTYAVLLRHLLCDLGSLTTGQRCEWIDYINSFQCEDGLFRDPPLACDIAETEDWWGWRHLTLQVLMALQCLGGRPKKSLHFIEKVDSPDKVARWLDGLDWTTKASNTSNAVQNYGTAMQYARDFMGETGLTKAIDSLLAGVAERCDPFSGLWGGGFDDPRVALSEGVQAGYHFWLLFWYDGKKIPFPTQVFASILKLQNHLGGFGLTRFNTSACEDIDGLDPMVRLSSEDRVLRPLAAKPIQRAARWVLSNFDEDGGAYFRKHAAFIYGHPAMSTAADQSSLFATWFRMLSLAVACEALKTIKPEFGQIQWNFVNAPGYQFMTRANCRLPSGSDLQVT